MIVGLNFGDLVVANDVAAGGRPLLIDLICHEQIFVGCVALSSGIAGRTLIPTYNVATRPRSALIHN